MIFQGVLLVAAFGGLVSAELDIGAEWGLFKTAYAKSYESAEEEEFRKTVFHQNSKLISEHNSGNFSYKLGMNQFGDWTKDELFRLLGTRYAGKQGGNGSSFLPPSNVNLPSEVDWRKHGYVTPVKNQGNCGSCWAFSTTGSLEGQTFKKTGHLVSLSEQNLIDCSTQFGNHGCSGGLMDQAFNYIKANGGIDTEKSYPYQGVNSKCRYLSSKRGAGDTGHVDIPQGDEEKLQVAVATVGPISVAIDASSSKFHFYQSGVFDDPACSSTMLDHGVLAVGYGTEDGKDYWLVKNSWGATWGDEGYIKMSRNKKNQCGIATAASYPLV